MSVRLLGGPFSGEMVFWDSESDLALVEQNEDDSLEVTPYVSPAYYQRMNAAEAVYCGDEPPDPRGST